MAEVVSFARLRGAPGCFEILRSADGRRIGWLERGVFTASRADYTAPELRAIAAELERLEGTDGHDGPDS